MTSSSSHNPLAAGLRLYMARSTNWLSHLPFTEKVGDSNSPRVPICFCSSVGRALRSHRRGRGFDYRQLHETLCIHSTAEGLFILFSLKFCHLAFQGADLGFAGGLLAFRGADGQVDTPPKWRNSVASKPFVSVLHRMRSPLKRK